MKKIRNRSKNSSGFTLAEVLIAVLILLMVSSVVATGIPAAANSYKKVVDASNAEVLLSTTVSALRNELATAAADSITVSGTTIRYRSGSTGADSEISLGSGTDGIQLLQYAGTVVTPSPTSVPLVSNAFAKEGLYAVYTGVTYENNIVTFSGVSVKQTGKPDPVASLKDPSGNAMDLKIRVI